MGDHRRDCLRVEHVPRARPQGVFREVDVVREVHVAGGPRLHQYVRYGCWTWVLADRLETGSIPFSDRCGDSGLRGLRVRHGKDAQALLDLGPRN